MICGKCGFENREDSCFCIKCGEKLSLPVPMETMCCPECKKTFDMTQVYCSGCGNLLIPMRKQEIKPEKAEKPAAPTGRELQRIAMISRYEGAQAVAVAKASGALIICEDRLELKLMLEGSEVYRLEDIESVREGRYMGIMASIVLTMKNARVVSFAGLSDNNTIRLAVQKIKDLLNKETEGLK